MNPARAASAIGSSLRGFARDRSGLSAVEFALLLPVMLTLYIGTAELGEGWAVDFKSALAARTAADLASQYVSIDGATMTSILGAGATVVSPYSAANMTVTVSEITTDAKGNGKITWSCSLNGTARTVGSSVTLPTALKQASISVIWGEVTYPFTPTLGYVVTGTISMYQSVYFFPRMANSVTLSSCS
jgi:Flp pilus assembly protein TadG